MRQARLEVWLADSSYGTAMGTPHVGNRAWTAELAELAAELAYLFVADGLCGGL